MKNRESKNRESNIDLFDIFRPLIELKSSKCSHPPGKNAQFYPVIITTSVPKADLISAYHFLHLPVAAESFVSITQVYWSRYARASGAFLSGVGSRAGMAEP